MKLTKVLIIIIVLTVTQIVFDSCCKINTVFEIDGFSLVNLNNSGGTSQEVADTDEVNKNAYGIRIYLSTNYTAQNTFPNIQFIGNSYALACQQNYTINTMFQSIEIVTLNNFDETHLAGANITDYFNGLSNEYGPYISIKDKINELNSTLTSVPDYIDVFLMKPPIEESFFRFRVAIKLNDGFFEEVTTDYVMLF